MKQPKKVDISKLMTVSDYAASTRNRAGKKVAVQTVYEWIKDELIQSFKIGKITVIIAEQ